MAQNCSHHYLNLLESRSATLRRKLLDEQSEQERAECLVRKISSEVERLRIESKSAQDSLRADRSLLKERQQQTESGRLASTAFKKEVFDRKLQIQALRHEFRKAREAADQEVDAEVQSGMELLRKEDQTQREHYESMQIALRAEVEIAEAEVRNMKARTVSDLEEATLQVQRLSAVQLCSLFEHFRHKMELATETQLAEDMSAELDKERLEQRQTRDERLHDVVKEEEVARQAAIERRQGLQARAKKKTKALLAKIARTRETAEQVEKDAAEHEAELHRQHVASLKEPVKQTFATPCPRAEPPKRSIVPKYSSSQALHAEFSIIGAMQEVDKNIASAESIPLPALPKDSYASSKLM
jgi:hypothetical protein